MSRQINFNAEEEYERIEYPGRVENTDRMIATLGGISNISKVLGDEKKRLELRFHPDNPYNKPAFGDSIANTGVLLSISVRRHKKDKTRPPQYTVRVLGYCSRSFTFETLCDFQYLPLYSTPRSDDANAAEEIKYALEQVLPRNAADLDYFKREETPLIALPELFARVDTVYGHTYRFDRSEDGQHEVLGLVTKSTYDPRDAVYFNMVDAFPTDPDTEVVKRLKIKYVSDEQYARVKKLFDECPIWTRYALLYESDVSHDKLKCIIPSLAFYFNNGPWRAMYVRFGYDPRKDFKSRYYQTFDFRLRFGFGVSEFVYSRRQRQAAAGAEEEQSNDLVQDINYPYFDEHKLPRSRQCVLRYCDVHLQKIQDMLEKIPTPLTGAICNERTGWLPPNFDSLAREIVCATISEILRNHYRKEHLASEVAAEAVPQAEGEEYDGEDEELIEEDMEVDEDELQTSSATENFTDKNIEQLLSNITS
ncbi:general transcription factor 3C polypeptide 5 [Scaptodrosophila lebanonensis]|uniref:General transcription factor 3C polypeptide 5 n=1 Tax=Drosophila lebanonensis TaxID=7225 RepID=A0A6J2TQQ0_DROLE|nr:general transcription factor 3C polypeptide 5 [Scaptodrosophila lebanonensis]